MKSVRWEQLRKNSTMQGDKKEWPAGKKSARKKSTGKRAQEKRLPKKSTRKGRTFPSGAFFVSRIVFIKDFLILFKTIR